MQINKPKLYTPNKLCKQLLFMTQKENIYNKFSNKNLANKEINDQTKQNKNLLAYYGLGLCYKNSKGKEKDLELAFEYINKAANQGDRRALYEIGDMYYWGQGVHENEQECHYYYNLSAQRGFALAQYWLGRNMIEGQCGLEKDFEEGANYILKAKKQKYKAAIKLK
ncbi:hypothetical protein PPERSA_07187 [Pseudocohnilembus persalinus]|uniref:Uncharacterized protein n=1 Tax=Pseudocohnilembus persalinus TaxID=266149 RepID=A0A0V0QYA1_PSEPJ|nr:hypothetical protein PPERSA_07187 [Pseudocohnilembus persalinus]|eukprot:KRX07024.1 hypothetical protein PPERSA_07187 [Pseudocohnilembus persalinus]